MSLSRSSELKAFLERHGLAAKKALSQNFLIDGNILRKIIETAALEPGETVVEIGPGPGALTEALLERKARVIAIEKDRDFARLLHRFPVTVVEGDCLDYPYKTLANAKIVANLPYQITTPLLSRLLPLHEHIKTLTFMVQKEVAERLVALPKTKAYGSLTVFLQFYASARYVTTVSRNCFYPKPNIDSAIVHITLHPPPDVDIDGFFTLVRTAFQQRRKMLRSSLKAYPHIGDLTARPEELSLDDFLTLFEQVSQPPK